MAKLKKETRGGKRPNAGRKPSPYKTTTVSVRIRVEWADEMRKYIADKKRELEACKQLASHDVAGQSEQLVCSHCKGLEVYIDEYGGKPCQCTKEEN